MPKYRKKPVVIEAFRVPVDGTLDQKLIDFVGNADRSASFEDDGSIRITTLEGVMTAMPGDWIIKGVNREIYPCKHDIFKKTYEPVEE